MVTGPGPAGGTATEIPVPPRIAQVSIAAFCGTAATVGGGTWVGGMISQSPVLLWGINPVLFAMGAVLGVRLLRGLFRGAHPTMLPWALGWAGFWALIWLLAMVTDQSYQQYGVVFSLIALALAVPVGVVFGALLMVSTRALARQLHARWLASPDPVSLGAGSAGWLLGAAVIKWLAQPVGIQGLSTVVAAALAAWWAVKGGRRALAATAALVMVLSLLAKGWATLDEIQELRRRSRPYQPSSVSVAPSR